jgi:hypothetical protein
MAEAAPVSPSGKSGMIDDTTLGMQLQMFLDEWYYRIINSSLGKSYSRQKASLLLLDIFAMLGFEFSPDDKDKLANLEEDTQLIDALILAMPQPLRQSFDQIALQLQTILHEASRIRTAAEDGEEAVAELFGESDSDKGGLTQQVLKASVIYAAKEVSRLRKIHTSWRKSTDNRIERLLRASEDAEHANQQLLAVESQLSQYQDDQKSKSKGFLMSMAEGQDKALIHSVFSSWLGYTEKVQAENGIRKKFEQQIENLENKLFKFKEAGISNVRGVVGRLHMEETEQLMHTVWKFWKDEVEQHKADGDTAEQLKLIQDKMAQFESGQKQKAGQFMTRMASGNDLSLKNICLEAWIKFHEDYAKDREMEEQVKKSEAAFKDHLAKKKDEARSVLDKMSAGSETGLMAISIQHWVQYVTEEKKTKEMEYALMEAEGRFKNLNGRQKAGAHNMQNRVNEQIAANLYQRIFNAWLIETRVNRVDKYYNSKMDSKRKQLAGVQNLFKSFAMQLEQGLGSNDDDSSGRTYRTRPDKRSTKSLSKGGEGTVSLPDIHQRA